MILTAKIVRFCSHKYKHILTSEYCHLNVAEIAKIYGEVNLK